MRRGRFTYWLSCGGLLFCACLPVPSQPGDFLDQNLAPLIITADMVQLPSGDLRLSAFAVDPEFVDVRWSYGQIRGPFVTEQRRYASDGVLVVDLAPSEAGYYEFSVTASDGILEHSTTVAALASIAPAVPGPTAASASGQRPPPTGSFDLHITGQVIADEGLRAFALAGSLVVRPVTETGLDQTRNPVAFTLRTAAVPGSSGSRPGAVTIESELRGYDVLAVEYAGNELVVSGPNQAGAPSPGRFRTAESSASAYDIGSALVTIRFAGDTVTGIIDLSVNGRPGEVSLPVVEYSAGFTGTRVGP
jgi:hypothetical protein